MTDAHIQALKSLYFHKNTISCTQQLGMKLSLQEDSFCCSNSSFTFLATHYLFNEKIIKLPIV
uniref:Uncharacterized protein n=1 Tax=Rhizophora mucronata TaxID=61149 RepID=A0A2P2NMX8_RHIMU